MVEPKERKNKCQYRWEYNDCQHNSSSTTSYYLKLRSNCNLAEREVKALLLQQCVTVASTKRWDTAISNNERLVFSASLRFAVASRSLTAIPIILTWGWKQTQRLLRIREKKHEEANEAPQSQLFNHQESVRIKNAYQAAKARNIYNFWINNNHYSNSHMTIHSFDNLMHYHSGRLPLLPVSLLFLSLFLLVRLALRSGHQLQQDIQNQQHHMRNVVEGAQGRQRVLKRAHAEHLPNNILIILNLFFQ